MPHRPTAMLLPDRNGDFEEMTRMHRSRAGALALTFGAGAFMSSPALAAAPQPGSGDTAWMLMATALVLMMTIPGLALFYGGLVRTKNTISMLMQVFVIVCMVSLLWVIYGYSIAYTGGTWGSYFGGLWKAFLRGIGTEAVAPTHVNGAVIPEMVYVAFQMTFACITPALIVGAFANACASRLVCCSSRCGSRSSISRSRTWLGTVRVRTLWRNWPVRCKWRPRMMPSVQPRRHSRYYNPIRASSRSGVRWISRAAPSFTSTPASPVSSAPLTIGKRDRLRRESMAPHNLTMTMIGAASAVGRLVRVQCRIRVESGRRRGTCDDEYVRRGGSRCAVMDGGRDARSRQAVAARARD